MTRLNRIVLFDAHIQPLRRAAEPLIKIEPNWPGGISGDHAIYATCVQYTAGHEQVLPITATYNVETQRAQLSHTLYLLLLSAAVITLLAASRSVHDSAEFFYSTRRADQYDPATDLLGAGTGHSRLRAGVRTDAT